MERRKLEHSVIISAQASHLDKPATLLCSELGERSLYFRTGSPLPKGVDVELAIRFWDRTVAAVGQVTQSECYNGASQGVIIYEVLRQGEVVAS